MIRKSDAIGDVITKEEFAKWSDEFEKIIKSNLKPLSSDFAFKKSALAIVSRVGKGNMDFYVDVKVYQKTMWQIVGIVEKGGTAKSVRAYLKENTAYRTPESAIAGLKKYLATAVPKVRELMSKTRG